MPPRMAVWLVELCASPVQSQAILGDLSEEFSAIVSNSGAAAARGWYWRQAITTSVGLLFGQVRQAPWLMLAVALVGWYLPRVYGSAIQRGVVAIHARVQVYSYIDAYSFWLLYGVLVRSVIAPMVAGWALATALRQRPVVALVLATSGALATVIPLSVFMWTAIQHWPTHPVLMRLDEMALMEMLVVTSLAFVATLAGAVLARKYRHSNTFQSVTN